MFNWSTLTFQWKTIFTTTNNLFVWKVKKEIKHISFLFLLIDKLLLKFDDNSYHWELFNKLFLDARLERLGAYHILIIKRVTYKVGIL